MVSSYDRYEQSKSFGVIASQANIVWIPSGDKDSSKSSGKVISAGIEETLIWDVKTGELLRRLTDGLVVGASNAPTMKPPSPVTRIAFHTSNVIATGYADGTIKVWDITSGTVIMTLQGHKSSVTVLKFDSSGTRLVSGSSDTTIIVWDLVGEEGLCRLKGHKTPITGVELLRENLENTESDVNECYLVSTSKNGLIKLWDLKSQQCVETHISHSHECWSLGLNRTSNFVMTSGNNDQVKMWEVNLALPDNHKLIDKGTFEKQSKSRCTEIAFQTYRHSREKFDFFLLQNADRTVEIYRLRSPQEISKGISRREKRLKEKGYSGEEVKKAMSENEISLIVAPFTTLRTNSKIKSCTWAHHGVSGRKLDLILSLTQNAIEYYRIEVPENVRKTQAGEILFTKQHSIDLFGHRTDIRTMDVSKDNKLLATASNGELKIWNLKTTNVIRSFVLNGGYALCCKFLAGETLVVVGFKNGDLEIYDLATSSLVDKVEKAHQSRNSSTEENGAAIWSLDIAPDGKTLVTGGNDKSVKFWKFDVRTDKIPGAQNSVTTICLAHFQTLQLSDEVLSVKISPDSRLLAIALLNNNVQVVFFDSLKLYLTLYGHKLPVLSIDISFDSKLIITSSAEKNIKIWGLDFGDCHRSIFGHQDSIMCVKFIGESHNFFSAGKDGMIKYWDGDKFECIQRLPAHQSEVWCLAIGGDGSSFVSSSHDGSIRLWQSSDDQVFLEEEREKEMDEQYENTLLESLEDTQVSSRRNENEEDSEESTKVMHQNMESLKAGERLMEALDVFDEDALQNEAYLSELRKFESKLSSAAPIKPTPNVILSTLKVSGEEYVMRVLSSIKPSQLENALLVLPFSYSLKVLKFLHVCTDKGNSHSSAAHSSLICKVLFFVIMCNANEFIHQRDPALKLQLLSVRTKLRDLLSSTSDQLGYNIQALKFLQQQWKLQHETAFVDDTEQNSYEDRKAIKRSYVTI